MMDIGPVLHIDDVVAGKMSTLFTRAEPRDFLDVDAALVTGRYTREQLLEVPEEPTPASTAESWPTCWQCCSGIPTAGSPRTAPIPTASLPCGERFAQWREQLLSDR